MGLYGIENCSVAEPESVEPKLFCGTGAVISYFGSGSTAPEPKYLPNLLINIILSCRQFGGCQDK